MRDPFVDDELPERLTLGVLHGRIDCIVPCPAVGVVICVVASTGFEQVRKLSGCADTAFEFALIEGNSISALFAERFCPLRIVIDCLLRNLVQHREDIASQRRNCHGDDKGFRYVPQQVGLYVHAGAQHPSAAGDGREDV